MISSTKTRILVFTTLLAGVFTTFSWRLMQIQIAEHEKWSDIAAKKNVQRQPVFARRGVILSADGELLAQNEPVKHVIADGTLLKNHAAVADALAPLLDLPPGELLTKLRRTKKFEATGLTGPDPYIRLKKDVPELTAQKIAAAMQGLKERGIYFEQAFRRVYPNARMLSHVVGFVNSENEGVGGLELTMNSTLRGLDGHRYFEHDRKGKELVLYRGQERAPKHGRSVRLTIDIGLQKIVEAELAEAMKQFKPKFVVALLQRPQTGEILAMASLPNFDPNNVPKVGDKDDGHTNPLINRVIAASYEPGSTFKIVPTGAALTERLVSGSTEIFCENGYFRRYNLKDHSAYGYLTLSDVLVKSSNIGVCKLGVQLGEQRLYEYIRKFGFGERTSIPLPGEEAGILRPPSQWHKDSSISRIPMGHEIAVTPIQSVCAMSVIANGGSLMMPQLIREIIDDGGHVVETVAPQTVRTVLSKNAVETIREALVKVVSDRGTARLAAVQGYRVAGKTGTAQVYENGKPSSTKHRVAFVGFMPAESPAFTGLVMLEQPQTALKQDTGGLVAAPIFSRIAEKAARYLGLPPDPEFPLGGEAVQNSKSRR
jgi:cell division protein FtsI (penicillin-binding protein 3)/stage V sporulation protein D (sporulation-specific penicillin-binding protein)